MRTKYNVHSNSIISNIYIIYEFVFKEYIFAIRLSNAHLAHWPPPPVNVSI